MTLLGFEHVGTTAADLDRSIAFYCGLLGLRLVLRKRQGTTALAFLTRLAAAGVEIIEQPRDAHNTELIRRVAFCRDPDGIQVELIERQDSSALRTARSTDG